MFSGQHFFLLLSLLSLVIGSCHRESKDTFISNLNEFIGEVESNAIYYSDADWEVANAQFQDFNENQFSMWEETMTPSEKAKVNELIGKYQAMQIKRGLHNLKNKIENTLEQTKSMFKEILEDTTLLK